MLSSATVRSAKHHKIDTKLTFLNFLCIDIPLRRFLSHKWVEGCRESWGSILHMFILVLFFCRLLSLATVGGRLLGWDLIWTFVAVLMSTELEGSIFYLDQSFKFLIIVLSSVSLCSGWYFLLSLFIFYLKFLTCCELSFNKGKPFAGIFCTLE